MKSINFKVSVLFVLLWAPEIVFSQLFFENKEFPIYDFVLLNKSEVIVFPVDQNFNFFDNKEKEIIYSIPTGMDEPVTRMDISGNDSLILAGFRSGTIAMYSLNEKELIYTNDVLNDFVTSITFDPEGAKYAAGTINGLLIIYDIISNQNLLFINDNRFGVINDLAFHRDNILFIASEKGLFAMNVITGEFLWSLQGRKNLWMRTVFLHPEKNVVISAGDNKTIEYHYLNSEHQIRNTSAMKKKNSWITDIDLVVDNSNILLYGTESGEIRITLQYGSYSKKLGNTVLRCQVVRVSPNIEAGIIIKDEGLYILKASEMKVD